MYARANQLSQQPINMVITRTEVGGSFDPEIFGPPFWFTLHNAAVGYYDNPTSISQTMMMNVLTSLPIIIPCKKCKEHAYTYLQGQDINHAVKSRRNLFNFLVGFHNYCNERGGKPIMTLSEAEEMYGYHKRGSGGSIKIIYR